MKVIICVNWTGSYKVKVRVIFAPKQVLTKDSVTVSVDAVVYYRYHNPNIFYYEIKPLTWNTKIKLLNEQSFLLQSVQCNGEWKFDFKSFPVLVIPERFCPALYRVVLAIPFMQIIQLVLASPQKKIIRVWWGFRIFAKYWCFPRLVWPMWRMPIILQGNGYFCQN